MKNRLYFYLFVCYCNSILGGRKNESEKKRCTSAVNQLEELCNLLDHDLDVRMNGIFNYIQEHYATVTLEDLSQEFYLSKPYLSKYIKEKSKKTFGEILKEVRLRKAKAMLTNGNMRVEYIAESVGYQNIEHFNRLFRKQYGKTPMQFRNENKRKGM